MVDVYIPLGKLKQLIERGQYSGPVLESKRWLVAACGSLILRAKKRNFKCIYPEGCEDGFIKPSIPFTKIGYVGIATRDTEIAKEHNIIENVFELLNECNESELLEVETKIKELIKGDE